MSRTKMIVAALGAALAGASAMHSTAASAGGNVAWSVSVGGPGFAVTAGRPAFFPAPAIRPVPVWRPVVIRPAPVVVRPAFVPVVVVPRAVRAQPFVAAPFVAVPF